MDETLVDLNMRTVREQIRDRRETLDGTLRHIDVPIVTDGDWCACDRVPGFQASVHVHRVVSPVDFITSLPITRGDAELMASAKRFRARLDEALQLLRDLREESVSCSDPACNCAGYRAGQFLARLDTEVDRG